MTLRRSYAGWIVSRQRPRRLARGLTIAAALTAALTIVGCRAATDAFGTDATTSRAAASATATALEQRFTRVERTPKVTNARMQIARYVFAPSKLANDTAIWTAMRSTPTGSIRQLEIAGAMKGSARDGQYQFSSSPRTTALASVGDSRHFIALRQLPANDEWEWTTTVENAIGSMPATRATDVFRALLASAERPAAAVRADYRQAAPRTTSALGRLFVLDSVSTANQSDGSTVVRLQLLIDDDRLKTDFPQLAKYLHKYLESSRMHVRLSERSGGDWFDVRLTKSRATLRFRSRDGELQPLVGSARRMPDTLAIHVEASTKVGFFTVGVSNLDGEFVHVRSATEQAWAMRFTKEPNWSLPLIGERLLRSPLRRPFEGAGMQFRIGVRSGANGHTLLSRTGTVAIQESAVMRFLGNIGFTAVSEFAGKVEQEQNRFLADWFTAMRADL